MVLLFSVDGFLIFSPSKDKFDGVYASLKEDFKIEDYGVLKNLIGIYLDHCPYGSIYISNHYITQSIVNMIPVMTSQSLRLPLRSSLP